MNSFFCTFQNVKLMQNAFNSEESMRDEIKQKIKNSGLEDENEIRETYIKNLRSWDIPEQDIEIVANNGKTIQDIKHTIVLSNMNITDAEMREIAEMIVTEKPATRQIFLSNNNISDRGAIILAKLFESLKDLFCIDLQVNKIGKRGMLALYILKASKPGLRFGLAGNKIQEAGELGDLERLAKRLVASKKESKPSAGIKKRI